MRTPTRRKVLLLPSWYPDADSPHAGIFVQQQAYALSARFDVAVLHVAHGGQTLTVSSSCERGMTVMRVRQPLPADPASVLQRLRTLWRITLGYQLLVLRAYRQLTDTWGVPEIVHVHAAFPAAMGALALRHRWGVPYVITEHQADYLPESPGFSREGGRARPALVRRAMGRASAVIAVSSYLAKALEAGGYYPSPTVVPNIVHDSGDLAEGPHSPGETPRIVHVSLLRSYEKNLPMLLEALQILMQRGHSFSFQFIGDGPDRAETEREAADRGLLDNCVQFVGPQTPNAVQALFSRAAFSVVSSRYETFCLAAAESIAAGCPVVSTRCGGPEEFITDSCGVLVANDDAVAMADGIERMLGQFSSYDRDAMREYARGLFSAEVVTRQISEVYDRVLGVDAALGETRHHG